MSVELQLVDLSSVADEDRFTASELGQHGFPRGTNLQADADRPEETLVGVEDPDAFFPALPPIDGGGDAWLFLLASTSIETLVWGLPFSIGILHEYWSAQLFPDSESALTLAATLQTGLMYMSTALMGPVFTAFPKYQKHLQVFGLVVASVSLIGSAFVTKPWHLVVSVGCFYPFTGALYLPCATLLFEWFHARRGLAGGVMFAGTGAGGTVFPFVVSALLNRFGYKATMIALGIGFLALNGIALPFIKRRVPISRHATSGDARLVERRRVKVDLSFVRRQSMWAGVAVILMTSFANFIPSLWIPTYATELQAKPNGTALVALMNAASVPGNALTGYLSDRVPVRFAILVSCVLAAVACLVLWGLGASDGLLVAFSLVWGVSSLSFSGVWSKMISVICRDDPTAPALVFSSFSMLKGIGNLTSGPISTALLKFDALRGVAGAYGHFNFGVLVIYTGVTMVFGGVCGMMFSEK